ncbi:MAG: biotin transporter BioY [Rhodospirillales bacterium]|nr:biotin transporter BioY [Rhodospirillales bacterium]
MANSGTTTMISALWPAAGRIPLRLVTLALVGTALLTLSAKVQVPFWPVPMTMQTFAVIVIGMAYGWRLGGATVALYLLEGAIGLPVFAGTPEKGIGIAYMAGPTGGYLVGFVVAAMTAGWLAERGWDRNFLSALAVNAIGTALIFVFGLGWLAGLIGFEKAVTFGLVPFLLASVLKIGLGAAVMPLAWRRVKAWRG